MTFSPWEMRELAQRIEGRYLTLHSEAQLDAWEDALRDCARQRKGAARTAPDWPDSSDYFAALIVAVLRQAADDADAMRAFLA